MHKKIEAELVALAHSILELKNNHDVNALHKKATLICEKLAVLKFVAAYIDEMPNEEETKNENIVEDLSEEIEVENLIKETVEKAEELVSEAAETLVEETEVPVENIAEGKTVVIEDQIEVEFIAEESLIKDDLKEPSPLQFTLEAEFKDAISADVATELFERATKENPVIEEKTEIKQKSLNDTVFSNKLQVGLNDRIAFVKHLFDGSQEDFNRVLSQLNSFKTEDEAKTFVQEFVKPDYNWSASLEYEERLMDLIERKFL
ncbi:MAG: hypothetical protein IZT56_03405 [Bacteroidetes bacterium]|nr:hypothetical protein [Bacteroidota bacterium]